MSSMLDVTNNKIILQVLKSIYFHQVEDNVLNFCSVNFIELEQFLVAFTVLRLNVSYQVIYIFLCFVRNQWKYRAKAQCSAQSSIQSDLCHYVSENINNIEFLRWRFHSTVRFFIFYLKTRMSDQHSTNFWFYIFLFRLKTWHRLAFTKSAHINRKYHRFSLERMISLSEIHVLSKIYKYFFYKCWKIIIHLHHIFKCSIFALGFPLIFCVNLLTTRFDCIGWNGHKMPKNKKK